MSASRLAPSLLAVFALVGICALASATSVFAADATSPQDAADAVVLARNCLECHNASDKKGGLDLTRRDTALAGGDSGKVLLPGEPEKSPLLARLEASEMPPEGRSKLSVDERKLVHEWIAAGA